MGKVLAALVILAVLAATGVFAYGRWLETHVIGTPGAHPLALVDTGERLPSALLAAAADEVELHAAYSLMLGRPVEPTCDPAACPHGALFVVIAEHPSRITAELLGNRVLIHHYPRPDRGPAGGGGGRVMSITLESLPAGRLTVQEDYWMTSQGAAATISDVRSQPSQGDLQGEFSLLRNLTAQAEDDAITRGLTLDDPPRVQPGFWSDAHLGCPSAVLPDSIAPGPGYSLVFTVHAFEPGLYSVPPTAAVYHVAVGGAVFCGTAP